MRSRKVPSVKEESSGEQHCLICYQKIQEPTTRTSKRKKFPTDETSDENNKNFTGCIDGFNKQLSVIFVLKKLCDIPTEELVSFLKRFPDLEDWIRFCGKCKQVVESCEKVYQELNKITAKFNRLKSDVVKGIIESAGGGSGGKKGKGSRKKSSCAEGGVTEKSREFVVANVSTRTISGLDRNELQKEQKTGTRGTTIKIEAPRYNDEVDDNVEEDIFFEHDRIDANYVDTSNIQDTDNRVKRPAKLLQKNEPIKTEIREDLPADHGPMDDDDDRDWLPDDENHDDDDVERNVTSESEEVSADDEEDLSKKKETRINKKEAGGSIKRGSKRKAGRPKGAKNRKQPKIRTKRPTMHCPLCKKFSCGMSKAEMLCNHLYNKCPALKEENENFSEVQETVLCCPLCKRFKSTIVNMVEFANHLGGCKYSDSNDDSPSAMSLGPRVFECNLCSENKYMRLEDFLVDYLRHERRKLQCSNPGCDKKFSYKACFRPHWQQDHAEGMKLLNRTCMFKLIQPKVPQVPWWCLICQQKFQEENERDNHLKTVHCQDIENEKHQQYKCKLCEKEYYCPDELKLHEAVVHLVSSKKTMLKCDLCTETFSLPSFLLNHRRSKHGLDLAKCEICGAEYTTDKQLESHKKYRHGNPEDVTHFVCTLCQKAFSSKEILASHNRRVHPTGDGVTCEICGKWFKHNGNLKSHMVGKHNTGGGFKCTWEGCHRALKTKTILQYHLDKHQKTPQFKCSYCPKAFYFPYEFSNHLKLHEITEKPFQCAQCPKQFALVGYLASHVNKTHNNPKKLNKPPPKWQKKTKFPCPKCGEIFPTGRLLQAHNTEAHPVSLECDICGKKYTSRIGVRQHKKTAHEKKFDCSCEVCGKGMLSQSHLKAHLCRAHQIGEYGMRRCTVADCEKVFYSIGKLQQHMTQHDQQPQFRCDECGKEFYFKSYLVSHIKKTAHKHIFEVKVKTKRIRSKVKKDAQIKLEIEAL